VKQFVPKMRPWQIVLAGVVGLVWLGIGVVDLFRIEQVWDLMRSVLLIVGGFVILVTFPAAWRRRVGGRG
jgi:hypothetical protein